MINQPTQARGHGVVPQVGNIYFLEPKRVTSETI